MIDHILTIGRKRHLVRWVTAMLLFLSFGPLSGGPAHAFKMSVCEIVYAPQRRAFDVKCYLFQDDLRETLYNDPMNGLLSADVVGKYVLGHLELSVNGQVQTLRLQELRTKDDQVLVQLTGLALPANTKVNQLAVQNKLLLDKFGSQVNMVYVYYPNEQSKHTKMFDIRKTQATFDLGM